MGFTKTHVLGVFITESFLVTVGIVLAVVSFFVDSSLTIPLLLAAVVSVLVAVAVLLASILSLLFFRGCDQPKSTDDQTPDD